MAFNLLFPQNNSTHSMCLNCWQQKWDHPSVKMPKMSFFIFLSCCLSIYRLYIHPSMHPLIFFGFLRRTWRCSPPLKTSESSAKLLVRVSGGKRRRPPYNEFLTSRTGLSECLAILDLATRRRNVLTDVPLRGRGDGYISNFIVAEDLCVFHPGGGGQRRDSGARWARRVLQ